MTDLDGNANRRVLAFLADKSAHDDIADVLRKSVHPLGDVQLSSPGPYRYLAASTKGIIFGFAVGMHMVAFRLDFVMRARAVETGGEAVPECGGDWVAVVRRRPDSDWPAVDTVFWARKAYVYAREERR